MRYGIAYRSDQLNPVSSDDMAKIAALGLRNDFDLRTADERSERPDQLPPGVNNVWLNVLADVNGTNAAALQKLCNGGAGTCWFNQFDAGITRAARVDKRYAHALQRVVPSF